MLKYKQFTLEGEIFGQTREIAWDEAEGVFAIVGVKTEAEARRLLEFITQPVPAVSSPEYVETVAIAQALKEPVVVASVRPGVIAIEDQPGSKLQPPPTDEESDTPAAPLHLSRDGVLHAGGDTSLFGRMVKLSEVVEELRKRGHQTYEAILSECKKMADIGDICPPVDTLASTNTLESRLQTHLAGKGIAVPGVT